MCDIILFGLSLKLPIILDGEKGQGKQTAIHYISQILGLDIINIVISKSTKVDNLLMKIIIEKSDIYPKKLIVFQGINKASPEVLDFLNSLFIPEANIRLTNGSILDKGNMNIIGIFNKERDKINRDKIPDGMLSNCIYHIVDNPSPKDNLNIITNLFIRMDFGEEEKKNMSKNI
jgi:MoxR-like ATPase